jgi:Ca2+-binding EF-hand superfamily protein
MPFIHPSPSVTHTFVQTIFFWNLLVRQILRHYDINPETRPATVAAVHRSLGVSRIKLSQEEQEQIKEIFELFDTDGGGSIAATEMDAAMLALGFKTFKHIKTAGSLQNVYESSMDSDLEKLDKDGSRTITLDDFTGMMTGEAIGLGPLEAIWTAFSALSRSDNLSNGLATLSESCSRSNDGWGSVTIDSLKRSCKEFDVKLSEDELLFMIGETDTDGNGIVDKEEFMRIVKNAPWF